MVSNSDEDDALDSSELGTKNYWDTFYCKEVNNFNEHGDVGEVWFGEILLKKIIEWLEKCDDIKYDDSIIDLGCGNGWTLIALAKLGHSNLTGIDYSENAIELANAVAKSENMAFVKYQVCDLLNLQDSVGTYKVALDKGTYDAISLSPEESALKRHTYKTSVRNLVEDNGYFLISSCNWTEVELKSYFTDCFDFVSEIPSPKKFQFGGKTGNDYSTIIFKKRS